MASLNKVMLIGNLTRDPELRVTPKGTAICQFGLAVNRQFKDESGATRDETTFVDIEAWGKQGETVAKYCVKGRPLFVEGRLKLDTWDDKTTGQKRSKMKIVLENFQFLGGREGGEGGGASGSAPRAASSGSDEGIDQTIERHTPPPRGNSKPTPPPQDNIDEDVPF
ncbi:MAG: single-stranded DNA-binding protein [Rariglobus sp.]|jgi:single-strand DNA-binding protein|nr:single-stranded DNA-binding protein [Rariglobus sp.]